MHTFGFGDIFYKVHKFAINKLYRISYNIDIVQCMGENIQSTF